MTYHKGRTTIAVLIHRCLTERTGITNRSPDRNEVSVDHPHILSTENGVEMFENLPANELIVAINNHENFIGFTEFVSSPVEIRHRHLPLLVDDDCDFLVRNVVFLDILFDKVSCLIFRSIVDEDNPII